uniref:NADH-ubiquinone oxidoreductase chain 4L n=1 Tax=Tityus serrulatus TaxID=6887 RepID=A0A0K1LX57_TITSE|nr:NADH dehydrogenase subunit 4L [Tityus serrulatus]AKU46798.1 NADH dehydrogenase subunit 4L [Tityus serrulatus]
MMNYSLTLGLMTLLLGLLSLCSRFKHLLSMLLSLELISLSMLIIISSITVENSSDSSMIMIFITLVVCEGSIGLASLVNLSRVKGNSFINSTISL